MTGIGAYFYIQWGIWLRHCINGDQDQFEMVWPRLVTSFPTVERINSEYDGVPNGRAKGMLNGVANGPANGVLNGVPNGTMKRSD